MLGHHVTVLEARARTGGRVHTVSLRGPSGGTGSADLGAMVVTGTEGNPIVALAKMSRSRLHRIGKGCRIGNFVEVKKSQLGAGTKVNHLSYIGDASLGESVNVGAGTITANYDGVRKHRTVIGDNSKTGANSVLVAPISIGNQVTNGAGSTIPKDVGDGALAIGRAKQMTKEGWAQRPV